MSYYPPSGSSYPYSAYHPPQPNPYHSQHVQSTGTYPTSSYQSSYPPPTSVQGYGTTWSYGYSFYAPHQQQAQQQQQQQPQQPQASTKARPAATASSTTSNRSSPATTTATTTSTTQTFAAQPAPTTSVIAPSAPQRTQATSTYTYMPSYTSTLAAASSGGARGGKKSTFRGLFTKELRNLMYGFGDDRNPANDTVNVMEEILVEYIVDVCQTSLAPGKKSRLSIEDLRRTLSRPADAKKLARMEELLFMQEDIKRARAQFEESDMNQATSFQA